MIKCIILARTVVGLTMPPMIDSRALNSHQSTLPYSYAYTIKTPPTKTSSGAIKTSETHVSVSGYTSTGSTSYGSTAMGASQRLAVQPVVSRYIVSPQSTVGSRVLSKTTTFARSVTPPIRSSEVKRVTTTRTRQGRRTIGGEAARQHHHASGFHTSRLDETDDEYFNHEEDDEDEGYDDEYEDDDLPPSNGKSTIQFEMSGNTKGSKLTHLARNAFTTLDSSEMKPKSMPVVKSTGHIGMRPRVVELRTAKVNLPSTRVSAINSDNSLLTRLATAKNTVSRTMVGVPAPPKTRVKTDIIRKTTKSIRYSNNAPLPPSRLNL